MNKSSRSAQGGGPSGGVVVVLSRIMGSDNTRFLREFVRDRVHTAPIAPSSSALAEAMVAAVASVGHPTVVELGPGTGWAGEQRTSCGADRAAELLDPPHFSP